MSFYLETLRFLRDKGDLLPTDSILVVAGGTFDRDCLLEMGAQDVVISNLEPHHGTTDYSPFRWEQLDAELLDKPDGSFDWVVVHAGLHHLAVPAKGACEMFRVARKGILCIEARDSWLVRGVARVGLTTNYELEPVMLSGGGHGGYRNGPLPNYIYRWTEREFEKTINSFAPSHAHRFLYRYGYSVPLARFAMARSPAYRAAGRAMAAVARLAGAVLPRQGNKFALIAVKNHSRQPWLDEELKFRPTYLAAKYDPSKYIHPER